MELFHEYRMVGIDKIDIFSGVQNQGFGQQVFVGNLNGFAAEDDRDLLDDLILGDLKKGSQGPDDLGDNEREVTAAPPPPGPF